MALINKLSILKDSIQDGSVTDALIVFHWEDSPFIAYQYINEIANQRRLETRVIDDFDSEFKDIHDDEFYITENVLKIYITDEFCSDLIDELPYIKNCVVVAHKIEEGTRFSMAVAGVLYEIPKLKEWQIKSYVKSRCEGLEQNRIDWLCDITNYNIYRIANEIEKVSIFPKEQQTEVFDSIEADGEFLDLNQRKIWDLTNPIEENNPHQLVEVLKDIDNMDVNEYSLVSTLKDTFALIIKMKMEPKLTAKDLNIKEGRFKALRWKLNKYPETKLIKIYEFLTDFDYNLKSGNLDIQSDRLVDYIICSIMS